MGAEGSKVPLASSFSRLETEDISPTDAAFWNTVLSATPDQYASLAADRARAALKEKPRNVALLSRKAVSNLLKAHQKEGQLAASEQQGVLASAAMLSRLLPVLYEKEAEHKFVETVFWEGKMPASGEGKEEGEGGEDAEGLEGKELAGLLVEAAMGLLFKVGFTVTAEEAKEGWCGGVARAAGRGAQRGLDGQRAEMLKLVLTAASQTLFVTPDSYKSQPNRWLAAFTSRPAAEADLLFQSLTAVIFSYDPVGMGIPYSSSLVADVRETVVDLAVQVLIVFLDYVIPNPQGASAGGGGGAVEAAVATERVLDTTQVAAKSANTGNCFRDALRRLASEADFEAIFSGLCRLLNNPCQANNTLLPSSMKQISCFQELLILLWKLIDENKEFLGFILRVGDINELVVPMLYFMYEGRKDPSKIGLIHICTFILLLLSGERNFCVNLNAAYSKKLPVDLPPFTGNHADLLYIVIHKLITDGPAKLDTLYDIFLTTMSNVSPYIKTFCMPAALRATNLFESFATRKRLLNNQHYPRYMLFILEVFNNVIQYQYEGNPHFIYQILRRKKVFAELKEMAERAEGADKEKEKEAASTAAGEGEGKEESEEDKKKAELEAKITPEMIKWAEGLPLQPCLRIMQHLLPQLEQFCTSGNVNDENIVVDFLKTTTMVGLLPVPHPILIRKYQQNEFTSLWFTTYIWGVIYLRNQSPPYFDAAHIRLFTISYVDA